MAEFSSKGTVLGTITLYPQQPGASQLRLEGAMTIAIEEIFIRPQYMQDDGSLGLYCKYTDIHGVNPKFFAGYVCRWNADGPQI
jgi:hypothetical protein